MLVYLYDAWETFKKVVTWATAPALAVVSFVDNNPKSAIAVWAVSIWAAIRYF